MAHGIFTIKFTAKDANGKKVRFNVREPNSPNAWKYAWERAVLIAEAKGWTDLKFAD